MAPESFQLVQRSGPAPGKINSLTKNEIYVGRDITNDIVINDPEVSRKHARLTFQSGGYLLEDLGSTNGTFIDGQRITGPHMLSLGEAIMLGDNVTLVYEPAERDADATVAVAPDEEMAAPAAFESAQPAPTSEARFRGEEPFDPAETPGEPRRERFGEWRIWLLAGCGCLVILLCAIAAGLVIFDALELYCVPPFDNLLAPILGYQCPIP